MDPVAFSTLNERMDPAHLGRRLRRQAHQVALRLNHSRPRLYWENLTFIPKALRACLSALGLLRWAEANLTRFRVERLEVSLPRLPEVFQGYRVLQLSDIHIDAMPDGGRALMAILDELEFDLCVITGDFRFRTSGDYQPALQGMAELAPALACRDGVFAVLGNHDYIEMVPGLEAAGLKVLLNEAHAVEQQGHRLWLVGVDDPHFYETHDLDKALLPVPGSEPVVLLAHSPEIIPEAADLGVDYYLCGHTHGGQVCLPGSIPLITNARCRRRFAKGSWRHGTMAGHTSRGTGASGLPVRVFCPPEITLHRLKAGDRGGN